MSVIKQPFQMLPFSTAIESQWRLRSDCFNDICDVPIIPKGKFIPFAIIADSDNVGQITLHCWDEPFSYIRTENFTRNNCVSGYGTTVSFSKTYYSTISNDDAYQQAMTDELFLIEGQQYANANGTCVSGIPDFYDQYLSNDELNNYSDDYQYSGYSQANLSISSGKLIIEEILESPRVDALFISRDYNNEFVVINNNYRISFDLLALNPNSYIIIFACGVVKFLFTPSFPYHHEFDIEAVENSNVGGGIADKFHIGIYTSDSNIIHCEIDNLKFESL